MANDYFGPHKPVRPTLTSQPLIEWHDNAKTPEQEFMAQNPRIAHERRLREEKRKQFKAEQQKPLITLTAN